jgi:glycerophosphoryl diester phosphodiesterase
MRSKSTYGGVRSGEIVVFHDETVDGATEPIPTLAEALDALPDDTGVNVELKHAGMADEVAALLRAVDDAMVSSFEAAALEPFREESIPTAYLFGEGFASGLDTATALGCSFSPTTQTPTVNASNRPTTAAWPSTRGRSPASAM